LNSAAQIKLFPNMTVQEETKQQEEQQGDYAAGAVVDKDEEEGVEANGAAVEESDEEEEGPPKKEVTRVSADAPWIERFMEVVKTFWPLGLVAFGGPQAHVAILRDHLVRTSVGGVLRSGELSR
jgi:hypothetical protein